MNVFSQPAMQIQQGSRINVSLMLRRGDGTYADLTGRSFVFRIFGRDRTDDFEATIAGTKATALLDGDATADLPTNRALQYAWLMRADDDGTQFSPAWVTGAVAVYEVGGVTASAPAIPDGGEVVYGVEIDAGSVVEVTSIGLPGLAPWDVERQTYAEWVAENIDAPIQVAIGEFQADQEQLQALADILVPSGATLTFRDTDNLMLLGDML